MANKKRNKKYTGRDAAQTGTVVKKFEVTGKFDFTEWRQENRLKIIGWISRFVVALIAFGIGWFIYGLLFN